MLGSDDLDVSLGGKGGGGGSKTPTVFLKGLNGFKASFFVESPLALCNTEVLGNDDDNASANRGGTCGGEIFLKSQGKGAHISDK